MPDVKGKEKKEAGVSDTPPRKEYEVFSYYRYNKFYYINLSVVIVAFIRRND
jgi:hypothetical protein